MPQADAITRARPGLTMNEALQLLLEVVERSDPVFHGAGLPLALVLLLACVYFVPREERRYTREPLWFLFLHLALLVALLFVARSKGSGRLVELFAFGALLASIGGSAFALFAHSFWMRRVATPLPKILRDVVKAFIYAAILLVVLRSAGVEPGSLLATSAFLTAVIGLSLQDTLGNLFAGLAIQAQRPFAVGDWVEFDKQTGHIGKVIEINWRATRILTLQHLEVIVPNAAVAKSPIINYSRPTLLVRRDLEIHAPYEASPEAVRRVLLSALEHVPEVLKRPPPAIRTKDFSERGMNYWVVFHIDQFQDREIIDSNVRERLWYAMRRAGWMIPVPRRRVEIHDERETPMSEAPAGEGADRLLGTLSLFSKIPEESRRAIARGCHREVFATEEVIVRKGERSTEMYLVERGRVRVEISGEDGSPRVVAKLGRGDFFGEMSLMTGEERTADVIAEEETVVIVVERASLVPVLEKHPDLAEHISTVLAERRRLMVESSAEVEDAGPESAHDQFEILRRIRKFFS